ncbi:MAG: protein kinase [Pirellulales bacterium]
MNEESADRRNDCSADSGKGADEALLESLLEQFDAASAEGATPASADHDRGLPAELHTELLELQQCVALLNLAARQGALTVFDRSTGIAADTPHEDPIADDRSFVGERIGRFEIVRELGRGGYGIVFLAHDSDMARDVALKLPRPEALVTPDLRRRFLREAQAAGRLDHPHILPVFEVGEDGGLCYLVSPYCRGPSLASWIAEQQQPVDARAAAQLIAALAEALEQAHQLRVLHRDIKPGNVLLDLSATERPNADGRLVDRPLSSFVPKLADFGLAKLLEAVDQDTRTGAHLGTPAYMAPEAAAGLTHGVGSAADIYSLGAILYELLVGKPPLVGASDAETLRLAITTEPPPPRRLRPRLPRDLEAVTLKCLEKAPGDRYATAGNLAADLRRFLAGEPTIARRPGVVRRLAKAIQRRPAVASLLLLAGMLSLALAGGGKWYSLRLARELQAHNEQQYFRDIKIAMDARRDGDTANAKELLAKYEAPTSMDDPRGFEWYWLKQVLQEESLVIPTRHGEVYGVAYAPDGELIYSGGQDGVIRIWNARTGAPQGELQGHTSCVNQLAFTPNCARLVSASCDKSVRFWDVDAGREVPPRLDHPAIVGSLSVARHHPWLATGGGDGVMRIWNTSSGTLLQSMKLAGPTENIDAVEFRPDDQVIAATSGMSGMSVWSTDSWSQVRRIAGPPLSLAFCGPQHQLVLGNSVERRITSWDFTQENGLRYLHHFPTKVYCLRSASEHPFFVAGGGSLHVLAADGDLCRVLSGPTARVQAVALSPHDRQLAAASFDGNLWVWDLASDYPSLHVDERSVSRLLSSPKCPWIVVVDFAFGMTVFDRASGNRVAERPMVYPKLMADSGEFLIAHNPSTHQVELLRLPDAETIAVVAPEPSFGAYAISRDENTLAACDDNGMTRIFDVPSAKVRCRAQLPAAQWSRTREIALSDDGSTLMCTPTCAIDTRSGKAIATPSDLTFLAHAMSEPANIKYSPDGGLTALLEDVEGVMVLVIRDSKTNQRIHAIHHEESLAAHLCWSPDGKRLAALTANHSLLLFDPRGGNQVAQLDHPPATIATMWFDEDGQALKALTHGADGQLEWYVWRAPR